MSSTLEPRTSSLREEESLYEVVHGLRVEMPAMGIDSTIIATTLTGELYSYLKRNKSGRLVTEGLFVLDDDEKEKRRPDVAFVSAQRWPLDRPIPAEGDWHVVPDVAIEVISPTDIFNNVLTKVGEYFDYGVDLVWVVVPVDNSVYVYESADRVKKLNQNDVLELPRHMPGWSLPVKQLFVR